MAEDRDSITLEQKLPVQNGVSPNYYNPMYKCFTNIRNVKLKRTCSTSNLKDYLQQHPELRIYTIISHEPITNEANARISKQTSVHRVKDADGDDYIDEFGRYVYIANRIGTSDDVDLRYENVPEPELFTLQYIEDDLCNRKSNRVAT